MNLPLASKGMLCKATSQMLKNRPFDVPRSSRNLVVCMSLTDYATLLMTSMNYSVTKMVLNVKDPVCQLASCGCQPTAEAE